MNWTESKIDTVLKMAVCLAMIGSMAGCIGCDSSSFGGTTTPALSITSSDWTCPGIYFSSAVYQDSTTLLSGSHADSRPIAQGLNAHSSDRIVKSPMGGNGQDL
jgi:hypothetical protein